MMAPEGAAGSGDVMGATAGHIGAFPGSPLPKPIPEPDDYHGLSHELERRVLDYLYPQRKSKVRGFRASFLALLPRPYTWGAVRHWMKGRAPLPADVALCLAAHLSEQAGIGFALAAELRACGDREERRASGFCEVDATGRDRRGHWHR